MTEKKTLGIISLGCDKNRVDSEKLLASIFEDFTITSSIEQAQIIVINSCAFLESARREAIMTAIDCNSYRTEGKLEKLIMTGCLPQRFIGEIYDELTEVDGFMGTFDYSLFKDTVERCYAGERVNNVGKEVNINSEKRVITTPAHYAYLKIADGCNNHCTYCLIPSIRGKYRSESINDIIKEATELGDIKELILVAQDVTRYGQDLYGKPMLVPLIRELCKLDNIETVRLLYCYPDMITDELIDELAVNPKLIKYLDIPLQHSHAEVLKRMNRRGSDKQYLELIEKLKQRVPGIAIRTTFILGFPGETQEHVESLKDFVKKAQFSNAGFFAYSREEGTPAYKMDGQLDTRTKNKRVKELYELQKEISKSNLAKYKSQVVKVLCDGIDYDRQCFVGRAYFQAPDIDGKVYFKSEATVNQGEWYDVLVTRTGNYDLFGRCV